MPTDNQNHAVILFDGVCNLCNGAVQTIIKHDPSGYYRFAALQSDAAGKLLTKAGFDEEFKAQPNSVVLIENNQVFTGPGAVGRVLDRLKGMAFVSFIYKLIPAGLRKPLYDYISRKRYNWFGRREKCMIPSPELSERFQ